MTNNKIIKFNALVEPSEVGKGGAFVRVPVDIHAVFGKGRVFVRAAFDGEEYQGSVVNMGVKNSDGTICYILGVRKDILKKIGKTVGNEIKVVLEVLV